MLGPIDAHENDIFVRRVAALLLKQAGKVKLTHIDVPRQLRERQRVSVMLANILNGSLCGGLCVANIGLSLCGSAGNQSDPDRIETQRQPRFRDKLVVAPSI